MVIEWQPCITLVLNNKKENQGTQKEDNNDTDQTVQAGLSTFAYIPQQLFMCPYICKQG